MANEAKTVALRWLSQRSLTVFEVTERLKRRQFTEEMIATTIRELQNATLLDDERVAADVVERALAHHDGPLGMISRLRRRGIPPDIIQTVMGDVKSHTNWQEIAEPVGQRYDRSNPKDRARLMRRLARQGFPSAVIHRLTDGGRSDDSDGAEDY